MLPMNDIEDAIRQAAVDATGLAWIFANQPGERPPRPYGSILVTATPQGSTAYVEMQETADPRDLNEAVDETWLASSSVNAFGEDARAILGQVVTHLRRPSVLVESGSTRLGVGAFSGVRDLSQEVNGRMEQRAQMDIGWNVSFRSEFVVPAVLEVPIVGGGTSQIVSVGS